MRFKKVFLALGLFLGILVSNSFSLEPRLLWKMEIRGVVKAVDFAEISGDIIFSHGKEYPNTVTILNKEGHIIRQWGPHLERGTEFVSISDDGKYFTFDSYGKGECYGHYFNRIKGELWKKDVFCNSFQISPDGRYILAQGNPESQKESYLLDFAGKILWGKKGGIYFNALFSPDSKFIAIPPYIMDLSGKVYFDKAHGFISSISINGEYFGIWDSKKNGIYDKFGNLVFEGENILSSNGKIVVRHDNRKIEVYQFPEKIKIREFPLNFRDYRYAKMSFNGELVIIFGKRTDRSSRANFFLITIESSKLWEQEIINVEANDVVKIFISNDGKYFGLVHIKEDKSLIYFYQSY